MTTYGFTTGGTTVLPAASASVFFDGTFSAPRLQHPECVAIGPDGFIWAGSEHGQILRIAPDGSAIKEVAVIDRFTLGLAFDGNRALFACEIQSAAVYRLDPKNRCVRRFTSPGIRIPNFPATDVRCNRLLVSDSRAFGAPGPGIWTYDLATRTGGLWYGDALDFANGIAFAPTGDVLYVCETFAR